jgi:hypothetical protein
MKNGCKSSITKKEHNDNRYIDIGLHISESTLHKNSNVKKQLLERAYGVGGTISTSFARFRDRKGGRMGNKLKRYYEDSAHDRLYKAYQRPTIGWKLECDSDRGRAFEVM